MYVFYSIVFQVASGGSQGSGFGSRGVSKQRTLKPSNLVDSPHLNARAVFVTVPLIKGAALEGPI